MQNNNFFDSKTVQTVTISVLVTLAIVGLAVLSVWNRRADIFKYFAAEYGRELASSQVSTPIAENAHSESSVADAIAKALTPDSQGQQRPQVEQAVQKANPAVVAITIFKQVPVYTTTYRDVSPFPGFNFQVPEQVQTGTKRQAVGGGSGFIVSSDGLIITNRHVVDDAKAEYTVELNSGKEYTATVLARDTALDLAFVKITGSGFPYVELGDSDALRLGQTVIAIGNALGEFQNTVSVGIISGLSRSIVAGGGGQTELLDHVIQTDAAINPGNSGGPLLDGAGKVIGVNVAVAQGSQNIGFALPINSIKGALESVRTTGKIVRPYLGVRYISITDALKESKNLPVNYGMLLQRGPNGENAVEPNSPAAKAGLVEGDIIIELNGKRLDEETNLSYLLRDRKVGERVVLGIISKGVSREVTATLEAAP